MSSLFGTHQKDTFLFLDVTPNILEEQESQDSHHNFDSQDNQFSHNEVEMYSRVKRSPMYN
jgi:hypothetical protein